MRLGKTLLAIASATVLLGALAGAASARNLSTSSQTLRASFRTITFAGAFGDIRCAATIEGSFHERTHAKVVGNLVGYVTRADLGTCATGQATILRETLPWHIRYASFAGTLPNIINIRANIVGVGIRIREPLATCLGISTAARPATVTFGREVATRVITTATIGGSIPSDCGVEGGFSSTADPVTVLNSTTRITITLI